MSRQKRRNSARSRMPPAAKNAMPRRFVNTGYSGGGASLTKQSLAGYMPIQSSPQSDIDSNLSILRSRSYDMAINSPIGRGAIETSRSYVIGAGLTPSPKLDFRILGMTAEAAKEWQRKTLLEFKLWADDVSCDIYRKNNFWDQQNIAFVSSLINGDAWAIPRYGKTTRVNPYALKIQQVEANRICNPGDYNVFGPVTSYMLTQFNPKNGNRIINGIEVDKNGAVAAYWIASRVPYDPANMSQPITWQRVEAFGKRSGRPMVLQISHEERPEQYRGVPFLAPVIEELKQISRYTTAELTTAIIKAYFTIFFTENTPGSDMNQFLQETYEDYEKITFDPNKMELGPGTMNVLPPGFDVKSVDSNKNISTFDEFSNALITQIGAGLNIPAEVLMSKFNSSYSAARGALNQAAAVFKQRRTWFARDFCQPIYEMWLAEAIAIGRIKAPGYGKDPLIDKAWSRADWFGPVNGLLDPVKEVEAAQKQIEYGFSTHERAAAELTGTNFDDNIDVLAKEQEQITAANLASDTNRKENADELLGNQE